MVVSDMSVEVELRVLEKMQKDNKRKTHSTYQRHPN